MLPCDNVIFFGTDEMSTEPPLLPERVAALCWVTDPFVVAPIFVTVKIAPLAKGPSVTDELIANVGI